jgi:hypothetical protein
MTAVRNFFKGALVAVFVGLVLIFKGDRDIAFLCAIAVAATFVALR